MVRAVAKSTVSKILSKVPITTVEVPWEYTAELAAEVDAVAVTLQPFYAGALDTTTAG